MVGRAHPIVPTCQQNIMQSAAIDLKRVRELFRHSEKLRASDFILREIATRMQERLNLIKLVPQRVLDAGCGRGTDLQALQTHYPQAQLIGIDAAQIANKKSLLRKLFSRHKNFIHGDFGQLPLADQSVDFIWSNLALHWHPQPDRVFQEWRRTLSTNGLLMFSCFGPDSLKELRTAFAGIDQTPHTLPFVDMHDFGDMLLHAGFATPVMDMEMITLTYDSVTQLLGEVRALGGNPLSTRRTGCLGKHAWQTMCQQLEQLRNADGRIPLTLEIIYGHAFKPAPQHTSPGVSVIHFDKLNQHRKLHSS